jgi:uncharacterized membrane protein YfcA
MTISVLIILFLASFIQGAAGFGFALFAVPLLLMVGIKPPEAVALSSAVTLFQTGLASFQLRQHIRWSKVWWATSIRLLALPVGVYLLYRLDRLDMDVVKQIIGVLLLIIIALQLIWQPKPGTIKPAWGILAMVMSGIMMGFSGMSGPPLVLWSMTQDWQPKETRAFLLTTFLMGIPFGLVMLFVTYGSRLHSSLLYSLIALPFILLATQLGVRVGNHFNKIVLRRVTYGILMLTALSALLSPWL